MRWQINRFNKGELTNMISQTGYPSIDRPWHKYYNDNTCDLPSANCSMYDYLYACNTSRMGYTALNYFGNKISFEQLFLNINKVSNSLLSLGVRKGEIVSVCSLNFPETVYLIYAINKIGAICNMIGLTSSVEDIRQQLLKTESKYVFTVEMAYEKMKEATENSLVEKIVTLPIETSMPSALKVLVRNKGKLSQKHAIKWIDFLKSESEAMSYSSTSGEDIALIEYTGGSTGIPKGVALTDKNMNSYYENLHLTNKAGITKYAHGDSFLSIVPFFLAFGASACCHAPLCHSMELILAPDPSPEESGKIILKMKPSHIVCGRLMIDGLVKRLNVKKMNVSFIRSIVYGGEGIDKVWVEHNQKYLKKLGMKTFIGNGYGMTETAATLLIEPQENARGLLPIGNVEVMITSPDDCFNEYGYDMEGELCISSDTIMSGYFKDDKKTADCIFEKKGKRWIKTHDLAMISKDGYINITGRIKRIYHKLSLNNIVTRVYPMRIETTISRESDVIKCAVVGVKDDRTAYRSVVFLIVKDGCEDAVIQQRIEERCCQELPESHFPDEFVFVKEFPYTRAGKIDYKVLEKLASEKQSMI